MLKVMTIKDVVGERGAVTVLSAAMVSEAAAKMAEANKGAILVVEAEKLQGIFTERDLLCRVVAKGLDPSRTPVSEVMTRSLVVGSPEEGTVSALRKMVSAGCRHLPVVEGDRVLTVVSRRELMAVDIRQLEEELHRMDPATLFI